MAMALDLNIPEALLRRRSDEAEYKPGWLSQYNFKPA
jgi:hypothetical protein